MLIQSSIYESYEATQNACKLCTPLGACLAFKGIRGGIPLLHGSQGCSTYIRRYLISHFREPMDIACSNFAEETAIFGGGLNMKSALENICKQYDPEFIGIATTCLSETIGDNVPMFLRDFRSSHSDEDLPPLTHVSTPSYSGTHIDGFHGAVHAIVASMVVREEGRSNHLNLLPGMVSPADLRYMKEILMDFGIPFVVLPDYSETLDGGPWDEYHRISEGGTPVEEIKRMGSAAATIEFGRILAEGDSTGLLLRQEYGVQVYRLGLPIGINETDRFFAALQSVSGSSIPDKYIRERGRLIDSYIDGHKIVAGATAAIYGEEDLVVGLVSFLSEIGITPILCASGGNSGSLKAKINEVNHNFIDQGGEVLSGVDFIDIAEAAVYLKPDILIGNSKGYFLARQINVPLIRVGFPIHDRVGGGRIHHLGYRGAQELFDRIANTVLEKQQIDSGRGFSYM
ncbi:MAG: nitrogenase component 1 [Chloroflexota bacterium]|nr:nitrogenase component 1 [Chloroflexota bacterium]